MTVKIKLSRKYLEDLRKINFLQMMEFKNLQHPKMLYIGLADIEDYYQFKEYPEKAGQRQLRYCPDLIAELKAKGYPAVEIQSPLAADPSTMVVSARGLRTPFIHPRELKKIGKKIIKDLISSEIVYPLSYLHARGLHEEADLLSANHNYKTPFEGYKHPHPAKMSAILSLYGENFIQKKIDEAYVQRQPTAWLKTLEPKLNDDIYIFSGSSYLMGNYQINPFNHDEARNLLYGSPYFNAALRFTGINYNTMTDHKKFAFMTAYASRANQNYTKEFGVETAMRLETEPTCCFETEINQESNQCMQKMLIFDDGKSCFEIPHNTEWEDFCEMFRISYQPENEFLLQRRQTCLAQFEKNGMVQCYDYQGQPSKYTSLSKSKQKTQIVKKNLAHSIENMRQKTHVIHAGQAEECDEQQPLIESAANTKLELSGRLAELVQAVVEIKNKNTDNQLQMPANVADNSNLTRENPYPDLVLTKTSGKKR